MRRCIALLVGVMLFTMTACVQEAFPNSEHVPLNVVMVTTELGLEDGSANSIAYEGLLSAARDFDLQMEVIEPKSDKEYENSIFRAAEEGADLILALKSLSSSKMKGIAKDHPDTYFAVAGSSKELGDNVMSLTFRVEEGAFLAGIIAASMSESRIVGFIGLSADKSCEYGFRSGVKTVDSDILVLADYVDPSDKPVQGRMTALSQMGQGVDILFHTAGKYGADVISAAEDIGIHVIGSDNDLSRIDPRHLLCSVFKRVDYAVYLAVQTLHEDRFKGGVYNFGIDFDAVGYVDSVKNLPKDVAALVNAYKALIAAGDIDVPKNKADFEGFSVPEEGFPIRVKAG